MNAPAKFIVCGRDFGGGGNREPSIATPRLISPWSCHGTGYGAAP
jgi:hypothetical protein